MRMNNSRPVKKVSLTKMTGKKKKERPRKTWKNTIVFLEQKNVTWNEAKQVDAK